MPKSVAQAGRVRWRALSVWLQPFRSFNNYGLFASMTQTRPEIILEGSEDGQNWRNRIQIQARRIETRAVIRGAVSPRWTGRCGSRRWERWSRIRGS